MVALEAPPSLNNVSEEEEARQAFWDSIENLKPRCIYVSKTPSQDGPLDIPKFGKIELRFNYILTTSRLDAGSYPTLSDAERAQAWLVDRGVSCRIIREDWILPPSTSNGLAIFDPKFYAKINQDLY